MKRQEKFQRVHDKVIRLARVYLFVICSISIVPFIPLFVGVDPLNPIVGMVSASVFFLGCALALYYYAGLSEYTRLRIVKSDIYIDIVNARDQATPRQTAMLFTLDKFANSMAKIRSVGLLQAIIYSTFRFGLWKRVLTQNSSIVWVHSIFMEQT